jgi:hypothetical protein
MRGRFMLAVGMFAATITGVAHAAEWFVVRGPDRSCILADTVAEGYGKLAGPYATEAEANAEKERIAACDAANTDPDPDEDGPAKSSGS